MVNLLARLQMQFVLIKWKKNKIKHFFEDIVIDQNDKNLFKKFTSHLYLTLDRKLNVPIMDIIFDVILQMKNELG